MTETAMKFDYPQDATPEKIWAILRENAEQMKETDRRMQETDRQLKETGKRIDDLGRRFGDLGNRFGELAEHLVVPNIMEKFNALLQCNFENVYQNRRIADSSGKYLAEIDITLESGDTVIAVEVKSKPQEKDVDAHINRMEILRRKADARNDTREYQGAIAGAIMSDDVRACIHQAGFYAIEQTGDTVKITPSEGFTPRRW